MQPCFFHLSGVISTDEVIPKIKAAVEHTYGKRGRVVVERNFAAIERAIVELAEMKVPSEIRGALHRMPPLPADAPDLVRNVTAKMLAGEGDLLPVSAMPVDGTWPPGTHY